MYHKDGTVDVKLLADLGYIADRLRNLEQNWDLTELKDLHRRIVLKFDDPPTSVLRIREALAFSPTVPPGSPEQQEQEVPEKEEERASVVIVSDQQTPCVVVEECPEVSEASKESNCSEDVNASSQKSIWDVGNVDETVRKLDQLEDLVIAFYHSCGRRHSGCKVELSGSVTVRDSPEHSRARTKRTKKKHSTGKANEGVDPASSSHQQGQQEQQQPDPDRTMNQGTDLDQDRDQLARLATSSASSDTGTVPCIDTRQTSQPLRSIHSDCGSSIGPGSLDREPTLDDEEDTVTLTAETSSECCSQQTVVALAETGPSPVPDPTETVVGSDTTTDDDNDENDEDGDTGGSGADANDEADPGDTCTRRSTLEKDSSPSSRRCSLGGEFETDQNRRLRRRLSELTNNFCTPKQFQQLCDNLDSITDNDLKLLIRELKRKIEFAERMNWLCLIPTGGKGNLFFDGQSYVKLSL
uniref:Uncharacterized protein n=1 Tax=Anopheles maculatus TaxID=74869 RepID=A0A182S800_9DIPT